jgi:hypothetical protein
MILEASRRTHAEDGSQNGAEVESGEMEVVALADIDSAPEVGAAHPASLKSMSEASLDGFPALAKQALARLAPDSPTVPVKRALLPPRYLTAQPTSTLPPPATATRDLPFGMHGR